MKLLNQALQMFKKNKLKKGDFNADGEKGNGQKDEKNRQKKMESSIDADSLALDLCLSRLQCSF